MASYGDAHGVSDIFNKYQDIKQRLMSREPAASGVWPGSALQTPLPTRPAPQHGSLSVGPRAPPSAGHTFTQTYGPASGPSKAQQPYAHQGAQYGGGGDPTQPLYAAQPSFSSLQPPPPGPSPTAAPPQPWHQQPPPPPHQVPHQQPPLMPQPHQPPLDENYHTTMARYPPQSMAPPETGHSVPHNSGGMLYPGAPTGSGGLSQAPPPQIPKMGAAGGGHRPAAAREAAAAPQMDSVFVTSLKIENEQLQDQLHKANSRERSLQAEVQALKDQREKDAALVHQSAVDRGELEGMQRLVSDKAHELEGMRGHMDHLRSQLAAYGEQSSTSSTLQSQLQALVDDSTVCAQRLAESVEAFQVHVFPKFQQKAAEAPDQAATPPLVAQLSRLDRALQVLRLVVDARMDTFTLIRKQLQDEKAELAARLQDAEGHLRHHQVTVESAEEKARQQKLSVRKEVEALQELYQTELARQKAVADDAMQGRAAQSAAVEEAEARAAEAELRARRCEEDLSTRSRQLQEEDTARSVLQEELGEVQKALHAAQIELETLKFEQKFISHRPTDGPDESGAGRGGAGSSRENSGSGRMSKEKMDTMRMADNLLKERNKVVTQKLELEKQVKELQKERAVERVRRPEAAGMGALHGAPEGPAPMEVHLAAKDRLSDTDITTKLLRQKMGMFDQPMR